MTKNSLTGFPDFYIPPPSILTERVGNSCFVYAPLPADPLESKRDQILSQVDVEVEKIYDPDKFHITLLYIEDCGLSEIDELVSQFMPPMQFEIELAGLEIFDDGPSSVLVWRINPDPALLRLQSDLYFRAENQGLPISPYSKPEVYKPHVTVAYLKGVPRNVPQVVPFKLSVDKFKVGRDDYNVLFTVHLPTGRGERFLIEAHGDHEGQKGVKGQQGGSASGFTHVNGNGEKPRWAGDKHTQVGGHDLYSGKFGDTKDKWAVDTASGGPSGFRDTPEEAIRDYEEAVGRGEETAAVQADWKAAIRQIGEGSIDDLTQGKLGIRFGGVSRTSAREIMRELGIKNRNDQDRILRGAGISGTSAGGATYYIADNVLRLIQEHLGIKERTIITKKELRLLLRGETISYGPQRRVVSILDGPFSLRHGKHSGQEGVEGQQGGSAPGFTHDDGLERMPIKERLDRVRSELRATGIKGFRVKKEGGVLGLYAVVRPSDQDAGFTKEQAARINEVFPEGIGIPGRNIEEGDTSYQINIIDLEKMFTERHGTHVGQEGVQGQQGGSAEGFTHGDAGGKESGKTNTKRKDSSTNFGDKKKLFNKEHHVPFADVDNVPDGEDFAELFETQSEWEHPANKIVSDMIEDATRADWIEDTPEAVEEVKEEMVEERMQDTLDEMYSQVDSYKDLPIPPEELVLMNDAEIEDRMRDLAISQARVEIGNYEVEEEVAKRMDRGQLGFQDDPDTVYNFARNDDGEIVGTSMSRFIGSHEGVVEIYEDVYTHDLGIEPPEDLSSEQWLEVSWLATKERGKGYGTQMMGEAFQTAADDDSGMFLIYIKSAEGFYETFDPVIDFGTRMAIWTPTQVQELAAEFAEDSEVEKSLVGRESLDEIDIGTEGSKRDDRDLEPMNGAFTEPVDWNKIPRKWSRKIKRETPQFISPADQAVFDARKKAERKQRGVEEDQFLTDVLGKRSIQNEVADLFTRLSTIFRHGKHESQEGVEGQQGGSAPGFTHSENGIGKVWPKSLKNRVVDFIYENNEIVAPGSIGDRFTSATILPDGRVALSGDAHENLRKSIFKEFGEEEFPGDQAEFGLIDSAEFKAQGFIRTDLIMQTHSGTPLVYFELDPEAVTGPARQAMRDIYWSAFKPDIGPPNVAIDWEDLDGTWHSLGMSDLPGRPQATIEEINRELGFKINKSLISRHGKHEGQKGREGERGGSQEGFTHVGAKGDKKEGVREKLGKPPTADERRRQLQATANIAAANKVLDAQEREPELTAMMQDLAAEHGGEMVGLEFAVKSEESVARKVLLDAEQKDIPPEEAAKDITDANRYTVILPSENYVESVLAMQKRLEEQGLVKYDEKWKNYFGTGDNYDGYNTVVQNPETGERFELQFHTAESIAAKQQIHPMFEEFRALPEGSPRRAELDAQMTSAWENTWTGAGGRPAGWERLPGTMIGQGPSVEPQPFFHGTGAEAAKSIMDSGLKISFSDKDNWMPNVIYAASDRRDALSFAARSSEEKYAVITIDSSLAGSEPSGGGSKGLTFAKDIPPEAIVKIDVYSRGFQRKDDELIETIERSGKKSSHVFVAVAINQLGYSILGPEKNNEESSGMSELIKDLSVLAQ